MENHLLLQSECTQYINRRLYTSCKLVVSFGIMPVPQSPRIPVWKRAEKKKRSKIAVRSRVFLAAIATGALLLSRTHLRPHPGAHLDLFISIGVWTTPIVMTILGFEMTLQPATAEHPYLKWFYRSLSIALGLIFVSLSIWQSHRNETKELALQYEHNQEQLRNEGNSKHLLGQLEAVTKMFGILAVNSDPRQLALALKSAIPQLSKPLNDTPADFSPERLDNEISSDLAQLQTIEQGWAMRPQQINRTINDEIRFFKRIPPEKGVPPQPFPFEPMDPKSAALYRGLGEQLKGEIDNEMRNRSRDALSRLCSLRQELVTNRLTKRETDTLTQDDKLLPCSPASNQQFGPNDLFRLIKNTSELQRLFESKIRR